MSLSRSLDRLARPLHRGDLSDRPVEGQPPGSRRAQERHGLERLDALEARGLFVEDPLRRPDVEIRREYGELREGIAVAPREQIPRTEQDGREAVVAQPAKHLERSAAQAQEQLVHPEQGQPTRRELDGERHALEQLDQLEHARELRSVGRVAPVSKANPVDEERCRRRERPARSGRGSERLEHAHQLAEDACAHPRRDHDRELRRVAQPPRQERRRLRQELLQVVEDQNRAPHPLELRRHGRCLRDRVDRASQLVAHGEEHGVAPLGVREVDPNDRPRSAEPARELGREPRLADATRTQDVDEPGALGEQLLELGEPDLAPEHASQPVLGREHHRESTRHRRRRCTDAAAARERSWELSRRALRRSSRRGFPASALHRAPARTAA